MTEHVFGSIAVLGLGYVGLPLAVELGKKNTVIGFDTNSERVKELNGGTDRTNERGAAEILASKGLSFTSDANEMTGCQTFIVTVPTPVDSANKPDLSHLVSASRVIGKVMERGALVIYESTVYPGATEEVCVPVLEASSGFRFNEDFQCGYSPERINPGDTENTLTKIRKIVSGSTPAALKKVEAIYAQIITAGTYSVSSIRVAEAAKVIENTQRDLNIAFVNELSVLFERLGLDTTEVLEAAGTKWNFLPFRPGLVGGHCIGVDPYYLTHKAEMIGYHSQVILAGRRMNDNMGKYAARTIIKKMTLAGIDLAQALVGVMGVTFKENCPDIRNSKVFDMLDEFGSWGIDTVAVDSLADSTEVKEKYQVDLKQSIVEHSLDVLIVAVGHDDYASMDVAQLKKFCKQNQAVILGDLKALFPKEQCSKLGFDIFRL